MDIGMCSVRPGTRATHGGRLWWTSVHYQQDGEPGQHTEEGCGGHRYLFSKTGNQGNTRRKAVVDIGQLPPGYLVHFDAYPHKKILAVIPQSDMAIDDISFINCAASTGDTNTCKYMTTDNASW